MRVASRRIVAALGVLGLALAPPAAAADDDLAPRTAESGAELGPVQAAMALPHAALSIAVDPRRKRIAARIDYTVRALAPLDAVEFDLDPRYRVSAVTVGGEALPADRWSSQAGLVRIALPASLAVGETAQVGIVYAGKPRVAPRAPWNGGFVWSQTESGAPWIATAVQLEGCDLFWPCLDHPSKRVESLDLTVTVPERLVVASNGRLVEMTAEDGQRSYHWRARWPNGYGVSLQIAPYELAETQYASRFGNTVPVQFWHLPGHADGARRLLDEARSQLDFFESTIGPYPFGDEKAGFAETPHKGMEHQTINAYGEGYALTAEGYDSLLAHEFAHEWFANQLSNAATADMWLQEGFGTYMQPLFLRWRDGETAYRAAMWDDRKRVQSRVPLAPEGFVSSAYYEDTAAGWGSDIYFKGAWVLHSLRGLIGDQAFFAATRRLVYGRDDPAPGNFAPLTRSTEDFRRIVEDVTGQPMGWFFATYFRTAGLPELVATREGTTLRLEWKTAAAEPFAMPVEVAVDGLLTRVAMPGGQGELTLPAADSHFVLDPDARILHADPEISAWQAQEEDRRKKAAAEAARR